MIVKLAYCDATHIILARFMEILHGFPGFSISSFVRSVNQNEGIFCFVGFASKRMRSESIALELKEKRQNKSP